jgi:catechol 2,3-dioxygenase-like lactoylglutathione lyase family enzyme
MNNILAAEKLVEAFEASRLSRRDLVTSIASLIAGAGAAEAQTATPTVSQAAQGVSLNHVSLAVTDVERSAQFYSTLLGLKIVSRPGNGGINLGLGSGFLGVYKLANPGSVNHCCIGVKNFDADAIASKLKDIGIQATVDRNPRNSTNGVAQLYFNDPDKTRIQLAEDGYQG